MAKQDRWYIYVPEIARETFVFFHFTGDEDDHSWSVRDYANSTNPTPRYAKHFPEHWSASDVLSMAGRPGNHAVPAERIPTSDAYWHQGQILKRNGRLLPPAASATSP